MLALSSLTWAHKKLPYPETLSGHDAVKLKALYLARPSASILTPLLPGLYIVASSSVLKLEVYLFLLVVLQLLLLLLMFFGYCHNSRVAAANICCSKVNVCCCIAVLAAANVHFVATTTTLLQPPLPPQKKNGGSFTLTKSTLNCH